MNQEARTTFSFNQKVRQCLCDVVYELFAFGLKVIFHLFFCVRIVGRENCPRRGGPLLVISNHVSEWDPPFLGTFLPWQVHWMAKVELFESLGGWANGFFRMLHCVPIDREKADLHAVKQTIRLLKGSRPVVVFAEGGIRTDKTSLLGASPGLKEGAAAMAILGDCPILPVLLNGTISAYRWQNWIFFRRRMLEIVIGPVFELKERDRTKATEQILKRLLELKPDLKQQGIC